MHKIPAFDNAKVLVIGDVMLDCYWYGDTERISPEAPVPVVKVNNSVNRLGGAGNVALNIKSLDAEVFLLGLIGDDSEGETLKQCLGEANITPHLITASHHKTIKKLRILSQGQQLLRLDVESSFHSLIKSELLSQYQALLSRVDVVLFSDYNKGTLTDIQRYIQLARAEGKTVLIDPKGHDFGKYVGASLMTPNMKEFELVQGQVSSQEDFYQKAKDLQDKFNINALLVTQGAKGMTLFRHGEAPFHLKANAKEVYDVTGAGDTVIAVFAAALGSGESYTMSMRLANFAAGKVVAQLGASFVRPEDFSTICESELLSYSGLLTNFKHHQQNAEPYLVFDMNIGALNLELFKRFYQQHEKGIHIYGVMSKECHLDEDYCSVLKTLPFIKCIALVSQNELEMIKQQPEYQAIITDEIFA